MPAVHVVAVRIAAFAPDDGPPVPAVVELAVLRSSSQRVDHFAQGDERGRHAMAVPRGELTLKG